MAAVAQHPSEHQLGLQSHSPSSSMHQVPADELPSKSALETCSKLSVCDKNNTSVPFEKLYETNGSSRRTLIILVRHFYCGVCIYMQYMPYYMANSNDCAAVSRLLTRSLIFDIKETTRITRNPYRH